MFDYCDLSCTQNCVFDVIVPDSVEFIHSFRLPFVNSCFVDS